MTGPDPTLLPAYFDEVTLQEGGANVDTGGVVSCVDCRLLLVEVLRLGSAAGPDAFNSDTKMAATAGGALLVAGTHDPGVIQRFAASGALTGETGRKGEGPAEHLWIARLRPAADGGVFAQDPRLSKVTHFDSLGSLVKSVPLLRGLSVRDFLPLDGDTVVVAATLRTTARTGKPLHLIADGQVVRSYGDDVPVLSTYEYGPFRTLARTGTADEFWAAHRIAYRIERWSVRGELLAVIERSPAWFANGNIRFAHAAVVPPLAEVRSVEEDERGLLWVTITVADPDWSPSSHTKPGEGGEVMRIAPRSMHDRLYDTIIEVIDPGSGRVVASGRSDRELTWIGARHLVSYEEDAEGVPSYRVWRGFLFD